MTTDGNSCIAFEIFVSIFELLCYKELLLNLNIYANCIYGSVLNLSVVNLTDAALRHTDRSLRKIDFSIQIQAEALGACINRVKMTFAGGHRDESRVAIHALMHLRRVASGLRIEEVQFKDCLC
ncbi:hypothetical protein ALC53_02611 [Atta colombica]|uniref:Uncharacterized protein n=1 Tax=Atta colombica TaxID=520822 RepID=A0A195BQJ8_9HYME|nr:hypothetical protein ALC53_02611 [Atta colombica]